MKEWEPGDGTSGQDDKRPGTRARSPRGSCGTYFISKTQSSGLLPVCADSEKLSGLEIPFTPGIVSVITRVTARLRHTAASQTTVGQRSDPEPPCSSVSSQSIQLRLLTSRPELHPHPNRRGSKAKGEQQAAA